MLSIPCLHWLRDQAAGVLLSIKREMLDAKYSSESHTHHELSEQLTNNVSQVVFFSACEISISKTVLSSNCQKCLTNSSSGECTVNWLQPGLCLSAFSQGVALVCYPRADKSSLQCYCTCSADSAVNSTHRKKTKMKLITVLLSICGLSRCSSISGKSGQLLFRVH